MLVNLEKYQFGCFTGEKPMSGFYAVLYALSVCEKVRTRPPPGPRPGPAAGGGAGANPEANERTTVGGRFRRSCGKSAPTELPVTELTCGLS